MPSKKGTDSIVNNLCFDVGATECVRFVSSEHRGISFGKVGGKVRASF